MKVLVLGGTGFVGRHAAAALLARGHSVELGSRNPAIAAARLPMAVRCSGRREAHFEQLTDPARWHGLLHRVDAVVNAVGILRERGRQTYARVHHLAPQALAAACAEVSVRLVHVSALGLTHAARSRFITSKLDGEQAIAASGADWTIVRPSLLAGEGGYGSRWMRLVARWPVHPVPADATGRLAPLDVRDLGEAIAALCERRGADSPRVAELGGSARRTMAEHLAALRLEAGLKPAFVLPVPGLLARAVSHCCDLLHFSPFSFAHWELMRRDNAPAKNLLPALLGRAPGPVGMDPMLGHRLQLAGPFAIGQVHAERPGAREMKHPA